MSRRSILVVHRSAMLAEALAAGLARFPELVPVGTATTVPEAQLLAGRAEVVVLDALVPGSDFAAQRLRARGIRVVVLGEGGEDSEDVRVSPRSSLAALASAAVPQRSHRRSGPPSLTKREHEILVLVGRGLPGKQVARHLGISPKTVEHHKTRIFSKLGVTNQAAAVRMVTEEELGRAVGWTSHR